jgi:hypothetical protein
MSVRDKNDTRARLARVIKTRGNALLIYYGEGYGKTLVILMIIG